MFVAWRSLKKHHENVHVNVFNATGITVSASRYQHHGIGITMFSFKYQSIFNE
jgi:hypothetical protein